AVGARPDEAGVASAEDTVNAAGSEGVASPGWLGGEWQSQDIPIEREEKWWGKSKGKCKGKRWKGCWFGAGVQEGTEQQDPASTAQKQDRGDADAANGEHAGAWGPAGCPWKLMGLLSTLRMLKESGALAAMLPCVAVQWLPFLTTIVARKVEKINRMAQEGLDPSLQKMLEIIQEQAAKTPGLEPHAALIAEALSGDNGQRRLGDALLEFLKALQELGPQVQARFCEAVAASLLPLLEDFNQWACQGKCKGNRGEHGQNHVEPPAATAAMSEDELEAKVLQLLELQLASEEVIRDLLIANDGDVAKVSNLLTS
ncbi:ZZ-type domain-containing protein, partial [Durusdinium trenchii]